MRRLHENVIDKIYFDEMVIDLNSYVSFHDTFLVTVRFFDVSLGSTAPVTWVPPSGWRFG